MAHKTAGIIGGTGPESTIDYYRSIIRLYRERTGDGSYPHILINSVDNQRMLRLVSEGSLNEKTDYLVTEIENLARAGADFAVLAANTTHIVFDAVQERSPLPLISIVEAASSAVQKDGLTRVGLFGTRFTLQSSFYPDTFSRAGITLIVPQLNEQEFIHEKYMNELLHGIFLPETRDALLQIATRLREEEGIEGLILGGTELPLILRDVADSRMPFFDTTQLHVTAIVNEILSLS